MEGIEKAIEMGYDPVKVFCSAFHIENHPEIDTFLIKKKTIILWQSAAS